MEATGGFIAIAGFIFGILNIILFFKVWGMCDNVSKILDVLIEKQSGEEQEIAPTKHNFTKQQVSKITKVMANPPKKKINNDEDRQDIMMAFNNDCLTLYKQCRSKEEFENRIDEIINKYNKTGSFDYSALKEGLWEQFKQL